MTDSDQPATTDNMSNHGSPPALPLWQRIEDIRLREGWTRTQVAIHAGVARTTLDSWRRQPRPPLAPTVRDVADRLGIDRDEALRLAGIVGGEPAPAAAPEREFRVDYDFEARIERILADPEAMRRAAEILRAARIGDAEEEEQERRHRDTG